MNPALLSYSNFDYSRGETDLAFHLGMREAGIFYWSIQFINSTEGTQFNFYFSMQIREDADEKK